MKKFSFLIALCLVLFMGSSSAQALYRTSAGEVSFYSKTPLLDINAVNKK